MINFFFWFLLLNRTVVSVVKLSRIKINEKVIIKNVSYDKATSVHLYERHMYVSIIKFSYEKSRYLFIF